MFGAHCHAAAPFAVFAPFLAHGRHRFPPFQQVAGIRDAVVLTADVVPETVQHAVLHRAPGHPGRGGRVVRLVRVGGLRLATGPDAVGVVHEHHDVDEYPQQRRGDDYLARVQAELAAEHCVRGRVCSAGRVPTTCLPVHKQCHNSVGPLSRVWRRCPVVQHRKCHVYDRARRRSGRRPVPSVRQSTPSTSGG